MLLIVSTKFISSPSLTKPTVQATIAVAFPSKSRTLRCCPVHGRPVRHSSSPVSLAFFFLATELVDMEMVSRLIMQLDSINGSMRKRA
ncbi:hypothetical protein V6N13_103581 [Hibiscus sabdariffa]